MSYTGTYQSNIGYNETVTYSGVGPYVDRVPLPVTLVERLKRPNAQLVYLVTLRAAIRLKSSIQFGSYWSVVPLLYGITTPKDYAFANAFFTRITGVRMNNASQSLTEVFTIGDVTATPGTFFQDTSSGLLTIQIHPIGDRSFYADKYTMDVTFTFANVPKTFRDRNWASRLRQAPNLSIRIEPKFGGVAQTGGGTLKLINNDGFFDGLDDIQWDAGTVDIEIGVDVPGSGGEMAESDYRKLGTWRIEKHDTDNQDFTITLREIKTNLDQNMPRDLFTREAYPAIGQSDVGQPIPIAYGRVYGAKPILLDRGAKRFKLAVHRIRGIEDVRLKKTIESTEQQIVTAWEAFAPPVFRYAAGAATGAGVKTVLFNTTELIQKNSTDAVAATVGTWTELAGFLYVNPPAGQTITSGVWTVNIVRQFEGWVQSGIASVNLAVAEFTLGADWNGEDVSVDFLGRTQPDGQLMDNAADIVADILDYIGETRLDNESFSASRAWLTIGIDAYGNNVNHLQMSLYIDSVKTARDILGDINTTIGSFLFIDFDGVWRYHAFKPLTGDTADKIVGNRLKFFTEKQMVAGTWKKNVDAANLFSKINVRYAHRLQDDWSESVLYERQQNANVHNLNRFQVEDREVLLARRDDAQYYAQRALTTEAEPLTRYSFTLPWIAFGLLPGDQIHVTNSQRGFIPFLGLFDLILEVYEVTYDLITGQVKVVAGNRRAWNDTFGFWAFQTTAVTVIPQSKVWLKADGLSLLDGQVVQSWTDFSGNAIHATEYFLGFGPLFKTGSLNGSPSVRFELGRHLKFAQSPNPFLTMTGAEVFVVIKADSDPSPASPQTGGIWVLGKTVSQCSNYPRSDGIIYDSFASDTRRTATNPAPSLAAWRIYNVISVSGEWTARLDNSVLATYGVNNFGMTLSQLRLGATEGTPSNDVCSFYGNMAEFILFDRKLTNSERDAVTDYLSDKYNLGIVTGAPPLIAVPAWSAGWSIPTKTLARQNHGYWQGDPSELAVETDTLSVQVGRWW